MSHSGAGRSKTTDLRCITDVNLGPGKSGWENAKHAREIDPGHFCHRPWRGRTGFSWATENYYNIEAHRGRSAFKSRFKSTKRQRLVKPRLIPVEIP
jgi:hypothetical protein